MGTKSKKDKARLSALSDEMKSLEIEGADLRNRLDWVNDQHAKKLEEWRAVAFTKRNKVRT